MRTSVARMMVASVCAVSLAVGWPLSASAAGAFPGAELAAETSTAPAPAARSWSFQAALSPFAANTMQASGASWITVTGSRAEVKIQVKGLPDALDHAQFLFVDGQGGCADPVAGEGSAARVTAGLGAIGVAMTTTGGTVPGPSPATMAFPNAASYTYARTIDLDAAAVDSIAKGTATLVVYGIDENSNGRYDGRSSRTELGSALPAEATTPALCGPYTPMQMAGVPDGAADTGGGSTAAGNVLANRGVDLGHLLAGTLSLLALTGFGRRRLGAR